MKISSVFTRRRMGLDNNVWLTMLILIIVCSGLLAYKIADRSKVKPCVPISIAINGLSPDKKTSYNTGDYLLFKAGTSLQIDDITWNFSDNTPPQKGYTTSHIFKEAGTFAVTASLNDNCISTVNVTVIQPANIPVDNTTGKPIINITGKDMAQAGVAEIYSTDLTAGTYSWSVVNNSAYKPVSGKQASFKFKSAGLYTIQLILDGDRNKTYTKDILVSEPEAAQVSTPADNYEKPTKLIPDYPVVVAPPKNNSSQAQNQPVQNQPVQSPPQAQPDATASTSSSANRKLAITDNQLKKMLEQVVNNAMHASDFNRFFCSGVNTKVYVNSEKVPVTFSELCEKYLQGQKVEIESAQIIKDPDNPACETNLVVKYKKKGGLLKKIF